MNIDRVNSANLMTKPSRIGQHFAVTWNELVISVSENGIEYDSCLFPPVRIGTHVCMHENWDTWACSDERTTNWFWKLLR